MPPAAAADTGAPVAPAAPADTGAPASPPASVASAPAADLPLMDPVTGGYYFRRKRPAVGTRVSESETKTMSLTVAVSIKPGAAPVKSAQSERELNERVVEILASTDDAVTKVKVAYSAREKTETKNGKDSVTRDPVAGKTYIVEAKSGTIVVQTPGGSPAPDDEATLVRKDFKRLGKPDSMQKALPTAPIRVGDKVDSLAEGLRDRLTGDEGPNEMTADNVVVTLTDVKDVDGAKTGVFNYSLDMVVNRGALVIRMKVTGEVAIRLEDGMPVKLTMQAPTTVASAPGSKGPAVGGAGIATASLTRTLL
ncbi:MAG: hypothetical protein R3B70_28750 [Polyangiaceae bacterium]